MGGRPVTPPDRGERDGRPLPVASETGPVPEVLDLLGLVCIQVLLRLRTYSRNKTTGTVVDVHTIDTASIIDMPDWCAITGAAEHVGHDEPHPGVFRHRIRLNGRHGSA